MADNHVVPVLAGWGTATLHADLCLLSVEFVDNVQDARAGLRQTLRLGMTRAQARDLATAILRAAQAPHVAAPSTCTMN